MANRGNVCAGAWIFRVAGRRQRSSFGPLRHLRIGFWDRRSFGNGYWQSFSAALHGFDAGHIALSVGDGDPWRFFAGFDMLGRMRVDSVERSTPGSASIEASVDFDATFAIYATSQVR